MTTRQLPAGFNILEITTANLTTGDRKVEYVWQRERPTEGAIVRAPEIGRTRWPRRVQAELDAELEENHEGLESWMVSELRAALHDLPSDEELNAPLEPEPPVPESQRWGPETHVHGDLRGAASKACRVVCEWMVANRMRVDQNEHYYTGKAWTEKGERWGEGCILVVTHDGGDLYDVLNAGYGHKLCDKFEAHLTAELAKLGLRFERLTTWATGIYKD